MNTRVRASDSIKTRITLSMLAIFLAGLWSLFYYASHLLQKDMEHLLSAQQLSTVSVLADSISGELGERTRALDLVAHAIEAPLLTDRAGLRQYLDRLIILKTIFNAGVRVIGADRVDVIGPASTEPHGAASEATETIDAVLADGKTRIGRARTGPDGTQPMFPIVSAIRDRGGRPIAVLVGSTNLARPNLLDKIKFGLYGKTGGFTLVARQYRQVITASDKRRIMQPLPAPGADRAIDRFVDGYEGSAVLRDPDGVDVLASVKSIPSSNWYLQVALPITEAFAPLHAMQERMVRATLLMTLLAGALTWWMVRRQLAPMLATVHTLATRSATQGPVAPLPVWRQDEIGQLIAAFNRLLETLGQREEALSRSERKLSDILEHTDAFIYLKDTAGRYLFANRAVRTLFGVTMEQLVGQSDEHFFDQATLAQLKRDDRAVLDEGVTLKTDNVLRDLGRGRWATYTSTKLPLRDAAGRIYALCGISSDITERKLAEEALRIAAIAFECQDAIVVLDSALRILRVNQAFTDITGFTQQRAHGRPIAMLTSRRQPRRFYRALRRALAADGAWRGEMWQRDAEGEHYLARGAIAAATDVRRQVTHYVVNFTDATSKRLDELQRVESEAAHRSVLVREVHHRIKNNLQGITGILRQFAQKHPAMTEPINQAIGQVQSISVIHGLQGRALVSSVRLCELTGAIADEVALLWQTPVQVDIPPAWTAWVIAENEAVPIALVLNELILNAVKHGGKAHGSVRIRIRLGAAHDGVQVTICNHGRLDAAPRGTEPRHSGLQLINALMPRHGARIVREQHGAQVETRLALSSPVVEPDRSLLLKA
jgi:PAS domain S-box-containing protein